MSRCVLQFHMFYYHKVYIYVLHFYASAMASPRRILYLILLYTLRPWQNGRHYPDDSFKCIFLNENEAISIKSSMTFIPSGPINNIPALAQIMAWPRQGTSIIWANDDYLTDSCIRHSAMPCHFVVWCRLQLRILRRHCDNHKVVHVQLSRLRRV